MIKVLHNLRLFQKLMQVLLAVESNYKHDERTDQKDEAAQMSFDEGLEVRFSPLMVFTATFKSPPSFVVKTPSYTEPNSPAA